MVRNTAHLLTVAVDLSVVVMLYSTIECLYLSLHIYRCIYRMLQIPTLQDRPANGTDRSMWVKGFVQEPNSGRVAGPGFESSIF